MTESLRQPRDVPFPARATLLWRVVLPTVRGLGRLAFSMRVERYGPIPDPPFVVAANHYSHFDPPVVASAIGVPVRYLALENLFGESAVLDWLITGFGAIPVPRGRLARATLQVALARLEAGEAVGVFPEGTRVRSWGDLPPKRGAAWLAVRAGVPLVPVALSGTDTVFGLENRLRGGRIRVVVGDAITSRDHDATTLTETWRQWMDQQLGDDDSNVSARSPTSDGGG